MEDENLMIFRVVETFDFEFVLQRGLILCQERMSVIVERAPGMEEAFFRSDGLSRQEIADPVKREFIGTAFHAALRFKSRTGCSEVRRVDPCRVHFAEKTFSESMMVRPIQRES